jgi:hypothetical protein
VKIPYGISNFGDLRRENYFYVDKTHFLPVLEGMGGRYMLFLRPRRMGKSLFLSMLEHYYDLASADQFDALFGGLWVHEHPTPERNRYVTLPLDFSSTTTDAGLEALRRTFFEVVRNAALRVVETYRDTLPGLERLDQEIGRYQEADALMAALSGAVQRVGRQLYVLIDEYDHFTNRLLAAGAKEAYEALATRTGFVRSFYATLKAGTASGAIGRMFLTGVAPLLLDDMASGFNIVNHVSQHPRLHAMAGFSHEEVERALDAFLSQRPQLAALPELCDRARLLDVLERHYDGYRFLSDATERIFNSDMVLYFLKELEDHGAYPAEMLDLNVRTDYGRLQRWASLAGADAAQRREVLETIVGEGAIESPVIRQFGLQSLSSRQSFVSLLYYTGLLTLAEQSRYLPVKRLEIPNRVIRELQWEHLAILLTNEEHLVFDAHDFEVAVSKMAQDGDIEPFLALFHDRVIKVMGNKDLRRLDERTIKLALLAFISLSRIFYPLSEKEFAQGYCDLFLGVSPLYPTAKLAWLLEIKYLPQAAKAPQIEKAFSQAEEQLARYAGDEKLVALLTRGLGLRAGALVFVGAKKAMFRPWPPEPSPPKRAAAKRASPKRTSTQRASPKRAPAKRTAPKRTAAKRAGAKRTNAAKKSRSHDGAARRAR